jgi:hypothetical protein
MVANKVPSMDQNIQLGIMLIDTFERCDELRHNINGHVGTFHGSQPIDGEPFDGDNNVGDDFDLEGMDLDHDDDYDEKMSNMFKEVQTPLYEVVPLVASPLSSYSLICAIHMKSSTCLWMNFSHY